MDERLQITRMLVGLGTPRRAAPGEDPETGSSASPQSQSKPRSPQNKKDEGHIPCGTCPSFVYRYSAWLLHFSAVWQFDHLRGFVGRDAGRVVRASVDFALARADSAGRVEAEERRNLNGAVRVDRAGRSGRTRA